VTRRRLFTVCATAVTISLTLQPAMPQAQTTTGGNWKVPRLADGKPDLSGVWWQGADLPRIGTHCRHGHGTPRSSIISLQEPRYEQNDT